MVEEAVTIAVGRVWVICLRHRGAVRPSVPRCGGPTARRRLHAGTERIGRWRVRRSAGNSSTVDANAAKRCRPHDSRGARHSRGERRVHQASLDGDTTGNGTCILMDLVPQLAFHSCARYDLGAVR